MSIDKKLETIALHGGYTPEPQTHSRAVPLYRTASYVFKDTEHAANLFALKELGNIYTRLMNPTTDVLEQRVAQLEGGAAALGVASGTAGIFYSIINIASAGDNIIATRNLYGGTYTMFNNILPQFGIKVKFTDANNIEEIKSLVDDKTRAVYTETLGNPALDVADLDAISAAAHSFNLPLIVDSTFATPYLVKPLEHGADIVVHSLTKWMSGQGTVIGGIVVDSGKFNWANGRFPLFDQPDESYHGLKWGHDLGDLQSLAYILRMRTVPLRNLGAALSPDNAWLILQGLETLPLRMTRHSENAKAVATWLAKNKKVSWVRYPGLEDDPEHSRAKKYFHNGYGGMVVFGIEGGEEKGIKFINNLKLFSHVANVGDSKSLAIHPASTTHSQLTAEQQKEAGIGPELVRLSVGLENIDDLIRDLDQSFSSL